MTFNFTKSLLSILIFIVSSTFGVAELTPDHNTWYISLVTALEAFPVSGNVFVVPDKQKDIVKIIQDLKVFTQSEEAKTVKRIDKDVINQSKLLTEQARKLLETLITLSRTTKALKEKPNDHDTINERNNSIKNLNEILKPKLIKIKSDLDKIANSTYILKPLTVPFARRLYVFADQLIKVVNGAIKKATKK